MNDKYLILKESLMLLESNDKNLDIKDSKIAGKGVFAKSNLSKSYMIKNNFVWNTKIKNLDKAIKRTDIGAYVNHSNKPNLRIVTDKKGNIIYVHYQTIKPIKKGEELTVDYKTFPWEGERDFAYE